MKQAAETITQPYMRVAEFTASLIAILMSCLHAADERPVATRIERSQGIKNPGYLGTVQYEPTAKEKAFYQRIPEDGRITVQEDELKFALTGRNGEFVSWFGIVRSITRDDAGRVTKLHLENKYFTDMHDAHIHTVSINGAGDFLASVTPATIDMPPLELVRVYGIVTGDEKGIPVVKAEYVRVWSWFQFNFMDYGEDHSNAEWRRKIDLNGERVYSSRVSPEYYIRRLGPTGEQMENIKASHISPEKSSPKKKPVK